MIGSHNSFTYKKPSKWWGKLLSPWAKCQSQTIEEQIRMGITYLDLRVAFDKSLTLRLVHNGIDFPSEGLYESLEGLNQQGEQLYLRIILDMRKEPKDKKVRDTLVEKFMDFCDYVKSTYTNIAIDKIIIGWNWKCIYDKGIKVIEWHASVYAKWYEYIRGTQCWAEMHNGEAFNYMPEIMASDKAVILVDYIEYL